MFFDASYESKQDETKGIGLERTGRIRIRI